jgi:hypothetical protein
MVVESTGGLDERMVVAVEGSDGCASLYIRDKVSVVNLFWLKIVVI